MEQRSEGSIWDAVRGWAEDRGLVIPNGLGLTAPVEVPESVCQKCPICQGAAALGQLDPAVLDDVTEVAKTLLGGVGQALSAAAEQRLSRATDPTEDSGPAQADPVE
jgi:hypothetical protein